MAVQQPRGCVCDARLRLREGGPQLSPGSTTACLVQPGICRSWSSFGKGPVSVALEIADTDGKAVTMGNQAARGLLRASKTQEIPARQSTGGTCYSVYLINTPRKSLTTMIATCPLGGSHKYRQTHMCSYTPARNNAKVCVLT